LDFGIWAFESNGELKDIGGLFNMKYVYYLVILFFILGCASAPSRHEKGQASEHFYLGDAYLREGKLSAALKELTLAKKLDSDNPDIRHELGLAYMALGNYIEAEKELEKAISLRPSYSEAYNSFGLLYFRQKRWKEAEEYFKKALSNALYTTPEDAYTNLGFCYFVQERYKQALTAFKGGIQSNKECIPAYLGLGQTQEALGQDLEAIKTYTLTVQYAPENPEVHYRLGNVYIRLGKKDNAIEALSRVTALDPIGDWGERAESLLKDLK